MNVYLLPIHALNSNYIYIHEKGLKQKKLRKLIKTIISANFSINYKKKYLKKKNTDLVKMLLKYLMLFWKVVTSQLCVSERSDAMRT